MAARQFQRCEAVTFRTGETGTVAKVTGRGNPFTTILVWLRFPDRDQLVPYRQTELRRLVRAA